MQTIDLIGFGRDISKVRSQIESNLPYLDAPDFLEDALELAVRSPDWQHLLHPEVSDIGQLLLTREHGDPLQQLAAATVLGVGLSYLGAIFKQILQGIAETPFAVVPMDCFLIEVVYYLETRKRTDAGQLMAKHFLRRHRQQLLKAQALLQTKQKHEAWGIYVQLFAEVDANDPHYDLFFAFTLRQTKLQLLQNFLKEKQQTYPGDFLHFLTIVLIDFADILPNKTIEVARHWLEDEKSLKENTQDSTIINYMPVPDGYQRIEGKLNAVQLRRFFSFLHEETNGSLSEQPFLLKEEVDDLLRYGFSYPLKEPKHKPFSLRLDAQKSINIIYYAFYQLYTHHRPTLCAKDYKSHFAYFLKHHFDNFDQVKIATLKSSLRGARPKRMRRSFDLVDYLD